MTKGNKPPGKAAISSLVRVGNLLQFAARGWGLYNDISHREQLIWEEQVNAFKLFPHLLSRSQTTEPRTIKGKCFLERNKCFPAR